VDEAAVKFNQAKAAQQAGRLPEAISLYQQAIGLRPDYAEAHNNLGNALGEVLRFEEAVASLSRAAELRPDLAAIHSNLGLAQARLRRFGEAAASHRRALAIQPELAQAHNNLAMALKELGEPEQAIAHYRRAIKLKDGVAEFHHNLGNALRALRRHDEARSSYDRAIAQNPRLASAHDNLGLLLMELEQSEKAAASFRRAIEIDPSLAPAHLHLAEALHDLEQFDEAEAAYTRAVDVAPDSAAAHTARGLALLERGKRVPALASLDRAIAADPAAADAYYYRQHASNGAAANADIAALERQAAASANRPAAERFRFYFALGDAYEAQGRFDEAFENFRRGNELRRGMVEYNESPLRDRFERVMRVFTATRLAQAERQGGSDSDRPMFIVGLPRSGSTLIEQILACHPDVAGGGERAHLPKLLASVQLAERAPATFPEYVPSLRPQDLRALGDRYVSELSANRPALPRITDKNLANFSLIGMIRLILPRARILHVVRDPRDALFSAYCQPFIGNALGYSYDFGELGRHYRLYAAMMDHWRAVLAEGSLLEVRYEALVEDLEGNLRRILDYCGLAWDERCLAFHESERIVRTASVNQVRRQIYRSSIGRWRNFERHLAPLIDELGWAPGDAAGPRKDIGPH